MKAKYLTKKLIAEGCNPKSFAVLSRNHDAYCIDHDGKEWTVFYSERGCDSDPIFRSINEEEACDFFYQLVINQEHWHIVGFFKDETEAKNLVTKLLAIDIKPIRNDIPSYKGAKDPRFRVFVVGKDIFKVRENFGHIEIRYE
jgi:hypothetical protein